MAALYELTGKYRQLMEATVDQETGEVIESNVPNFAAVLAQLEGGIDDKLEGCAKVLRSMDADMASLKSEEERLYKRRKSIDGNKEHLRGYMLGCLETAGMTKRKTALFTIYTQAPKESVEILDENEIADEYRKEPVKPPPDKTAIKDALQSGKTVKGAKLVMGKPTLIVR